MFGRKKTFKLDAYDLQLVIEALDSLVSNNKELLNDGVYEVGDDDLDRTRDMIVHANDLLDKMCWRG